MAKRKANKKSGKRKSKKSSKKLPSIRKSNPKLPSVVEPPKEPELPEPGRLPSAKCMPEVTTLLGGYVLMKRLLLRAFRCADRVLLRSPYGDYAIFSLIIKNKKVYYLFDGCTCNPRRFRYFDLTVGTYGLQHFTSIHQVLRFVLQAGLYNGHVVRKREIKIEDCCGNKNVDNLPYRKETKYALVSKRQLGLKDCVYFQGE